MWFSEFGFAEMFLAFCNQHFPAPTEYTDAMYCILKHYELTGLYHELNKCPRESFSALDSDGLHHDINTKDTHNSAIEKLVEDDNLNGPVTSISNDSFLNNVVPVNIDNILAEMDEDSFCTTRLNLCNLPEVYTKDLFGLENINALENAILRPNESSTPLRSYLSKTKRQLNARPQEICSPREVLIYPTSGELQQEVGLTDEIITDIDLTQSPSASLDNHSACESVKSDKSGKILYLNSQGVPGLSERFTCSVCQRSFRLKHQLSCHMRTHTGEKPFKCMWCPAAFSQSNNLNRHARRHVESGHLKCLFCDEKVFVSREAFDLHVMEHHSNLAVT